MCFVLYITSIITPEIKCGNCIHARRPITLDEAKSLFTDVFDPNGNVNLLSISC